MARRSVAKHLGKHVAISSREQQPVVLLNHLKARIDRCAADVGVLVLTSTAQLLRLALGANAGISGSQLAEIERLVERDHRFHATGRRRRPRDQASLSSNPGDSNPGHVVTGRRG